MCGIAGFVDLRTGRPAAALEAIGKAMGDRIAHRGPDDQGVWSDEQAGVCLAYRRLAIIDLTAAGHQPMTSHDGRHVLVFNGEIYNHPDLRTALEAHEGAIAWRGHSDTEVLLETIARRGLDAALEAAVGMFALALWDRRDRTLSLARDRAGEKPLYYGLAGGSFLFASELKALKAHPAWDGAIDRDVIPSYLRYGYVPAPRSIHAGIHTLPPGAVVTADLAALAGELRPRRYWRWPTPAPQAVDETRAIDTLDGLLSEAVERQLTADVPLGCFLSGGIDSSLIAALAQARSTTPVRTYSIGFDDPQFDEAPFAAAVARHLKTDHTELYVDGRMALDVVPALGAIYDEPFADPSQIPTVLLSRLTRAHVTVALSGDGGDELFGGYDRYELLDRTDRLFRWAPAPVRRLGAAALTGLGPGRARSLAALSPSLAGKLGGARVERLARFLGQDTAHAAYKDLISICPTPERLAPGLAEMTGAIDDPALARAIDGVQPWAAYIDAISYLPDDILVKVDRASMSASLETRAPMLDPAVIAFAATLPWRFKRRGGVGKWPLRRLLSRYAPDSLFDRPKRGFSVPLAGWLRGELKDWAWSLLTPGVGLIGDGLQAAPLETMWREHQGGARDHSAALWTVLMLQQWAVSQTP